MWEDEQAEYSIRQAGVCLQESGIFLVALPIASHRAPSIAFEKIRLSIRCRSGSDRASRHANRSLSLPRTAHSIWPHVYLPAAIRRRGGRMKDACLYLYLNMAHFRNQAVLGFHMLSRGVP